MLALVILRTRAIAEAIKPRKMPRKMPREMSHGPKNILAKMRVINEREPKKTAKNYQEQGNKILKRVSNRVLS